MKKILLDKRKVAVMLFSAMLLTACAPKESKTTRISGEFTKDAPEAVRIVAGDVLDTTVMVTKGCFVVEIPTVLTRASFLRIGNSELEQRLSQVSFVADGSNLTYEPCPDSFRIAFFSHESERFCPIRSESSDSTYIWR